MLQRSHYVTVVRAALQAQAPRRLERLAERHRLQRFVDDKVNEMIEWVSIVLQANPGISLAEAEKAVFDTLLTFEETG